MKYDKIAEFIKPFIPDILKIYTDLLSADASIIKNFKDLIDLLEEEIVPFASNLTKMFVTMFAGYTQNSNQDYDQKFGRRQKNEEEENDDEESNEDEEDTNN